MAYVVVLGDGDSNSQREPGPESESLAYGTHSGGSHPSGTGMR